MSSSLSGEIHWRKDWSAEHARSSWYYLKTFLFHIVTAWYIFSNLFFVLLALQKSDSRFRRKSPLYLSMTYPFLRGEEVCLEAFFRIWIRCFSAFWSMAPLKSVSCPSSAFAAQGSVAPQILMCDWLFCSAKGQFWGFNLSIAYPQPFLKEKCSLSKLSFWGQHLPFFIEDFIFQ